MIDLPPVNQLIDPEWYPEGWDDKRCEELFIALYHGKEELTDEEKIIAEFTYQIRKLRPSLRSMFKVSQRRRELIEYLTGEVYMGDEATRANNPRDDPADNGESS